MNKYLIGALIWAIGILALTLTPGKNIPDITLFSYDKLGHGFVFFVLSFLLIAGFEEKLIKFQIKSLHVITGLVISIVYGSLIEIAQSLVPGRAMELFDALANISGSFLGLTLFYILRKRKVV